MIIKYLLVITVMISFLASCSAERSREEKVSAMINKVDSPFVLFNVSPGDLIEKSGAMDGALPFTYEMLFGFFIDDQTTGIDYDVNIQLIVGKGAAFVPNMYGVFKIKNQEAFAELMKTEGNAEVEEKEGFKYVIKSNDRYIIAWNDEFAVASNIEIDFSDLFSGSGGNQGVKAVDNAIAMIKAGEEGDTHTEHTAFLQKESDIACRIIGEGFSAFMDEMAVLEDEILEKNQDLMKGTVADFSINFNNGSIDLQILSEISEDVAEMVKFFNEGSVDSKLLSYGNSANPIMVVALNANTSTILDYNEMQMSPSDYEDFERELGNFGISIDEIKNALSGEFAIVLDHIEMKETIIDWGYGEPYVSKDPSPVFALVAGVSDKSVFSNLLVDSLQVSNGIYKNGDVYLVLSEDILFSSSDSLWAMKIAGGQGVQIEDKKGILAKNSFGMFANFGSLMEMQGMQADDLSLYISIFDELVGEGNIGESNISLLLKDNSKNSLRIITEAIADAMSFSGADQQQDLQVELEEASEAMPEEE